jgi:hypothetical protein
MEDVSINGFAYETRYASICITRIPYTESSTPSPSCRDTIENLREIYIFLTSNTETCALLARFRLWPLIFVPRSSDTGGFVSSQQVFWTDPAMLLVTNSDHTQNVSLKLHYGNNTRLQQFFIETLQVKREPTLEDYLPLLCKVIGESEEFIWKSIQVITRLAFIEKKQAVVKGISKFAVSLSLYEIFLCRSMLELGFHTVFGRAISIDEIYRSAIFSS